MSQKNQDLKPQTVFSNHPNRPQVNLHEEPPTNPNQHKITAALSQRRHQIKRK